MSYECHITVDVKDSEIAKEFVATIEAGGYNEMQGADGKGVVLRWKHSEIAQDPVLGEKTFFYLTCHDTDVGRIFKRMTFASEWAALAGSKGSAREDRAYHL